MIVTRTNDKDVVDSLMQLYREAFGEGDSAQEIISSELRHYLNNLLERGYALIATENEVICGAVLACSLAEDRDLPEELQVRYNPESCLYMAEMMVSTLWRGKGVGQMLMEAFEDSADRLVYQDAFIRVWDGNNAALRLYVKNGYEAVTAIKQQKTKPDGTTHFRMRKLYLHKKL